MRLFLLIRLILVYFATQIDIKVRDCPFCILRGNRMELFLTLYFCDWRVFFCILAKMWHLSVCSLFDDVQVYGYPVFWG